MRLVFALFAWVVSGCGASEDEARDYLEQEGFKVTRLEKTGGSFEFTAKKDDDICTGTLTITKGIGTSSANHTSTCQLDSSGCKKGAPARCTEVADKLYARGNGFPTQAVELYRTACDDKNAHACAQMGAFEAISKSWGKVREYSRKGCDLGDGEACVRLAYTELDGNGTEKNERKCIELLAKACDKDSLRGCRAAAGLLVDARPADPARAIPLAEKACAHKYEDGCFVLGVALFQGNKDFERALTHLDAACNDTKFKNRGLACNVAGAIVVEKLVEKDTQRGLDYFIKACQFEDPDGCSNAGKMYDKGRDGVPRDKDKAKEQFGYACKLGKKEYCKE